jgi:hypothetical protein
LNGSISGNTPPVLPSNPPALESAREDDMNHTVIDLEPGPFFTADQLPRPYILKMREKKALHYKDPVRQGYVLAEFDRKYGLKAIWHSQE